MGYLREEPLERAFERKRRNFVTDYGIAEKPSLARTGPRQDAPRLPVELRQHRLRHAACSRVRLRREPLRASCAGVPRVRAARRRTTMARHARVRRLQCVQGAVQQGGDRGRMPVHARRKFHELWVNHKSSLAAEASTLRKTRATTNPPARTV